MKTIHILPSVSAGIELRHALQLVARDDEVLSFCDDLSCGPIDTNVPSSRANWWNQFHDGLALGDDRPESCEHDLCEFWRRATAPGLRRIVWFGRHSALELAFFLAWTERLGEMPCEIIDVTESGPTVLSRPVEAVSIVPAEALRLLFGTERPMMREEIDENRRRWQRLQGENAPFRVVTERGLVSASADHFDALLLSHATSDWQEIRRVVGHALGTSSEPYFQVGDLMLRARVVALVNEGRLLADGDSWDWRRQVRLPA
ncbi:DUF1835 domain-containing protein [Bradyrhizobium sp. U87765 SZCCT0131]|uniref:DUF3658 domain-containing protein n=1 Tax=unclassified Bradyrhizobium TaxID=2631580 RepID=UPI001BAA5EE1|nr:MULTISPECIES: DUF3658 domain-containing protein [unclassified Bradyrhizobium]MBR1219549.1 DUF1835 domain-containing protein [Bradyrhizobium sp. U87765 SZCCT0131]MBR1262200.1 DUF1835 domain-containing protein [Bradyrhizobium sp. U87765 SZCCT0134]MBR1308617.1 DUF1835 domain-containing protein [Bradyrhizobium sp. U87765 SZCCT0110]MBR1317982.1 DUF1835 domain-containing protein [Bradyrhizobium sp. U87765 SZCCT0109]MBR1351685.1 DUF1835 domain-containing protein [Bradyrhizobium sp. U87765 SZCCT004